MKWFLRQTNVTLRKLLCRYSTSDESLSSSYEYEIAEPGKDGIGNALEALLTPPDYDAKFFFNLPYDIQGSKEIYKFRPKEYVSKILINQKAEDTDLRSIFHRFYDQFLTALLKYDVSFFETRCENRLAKKCLDALEYLKRKNYKLQIEKTNKERASSTRVIDYYLLRGLDVDRSKNWLSKDYVANLEADSKGLRHYLHRYFLPEQSRSYFYMLDEDENFLRNPEEWSEFRNEMYQNDFKFILRVIAQVKDTDRPQVYMANNPSGLMLYSQTYTGVHTLVFENLLQKPFVSAAASVPFVDWLGTYKAPRDNWKLVDIDNYLNGNTIFSTIGKLKPMKEQDKGISDLKDKELEGYVTKISEAFAEIKQEKKMEDPKISLIHTPKNSKLVAKRLIRGLMGEKLTEDEEEGAGKTNETVIPIVSSKSIKGTATDKFRIKMTKKAKLKAQAKASAKSGSSKKRWKSR